VSPAQVTIVAPKPATPITISAKPTPTLISVTPTGTPLVPHTTIPIVTINARPAVTPNVVTPALVVVNPPSNAASANVVTPRVVTPVVPAVNPAAQVVSPIKNDDKGNFTPNFSWAPQD
jgi:hypothetical protein